MNLNNRLLYDTDASYYFMRNKSDFLSMKKMSKPFELDQAVENFKPSYQGSCLVKIGSLKLMLSNVLYSPISSYDKISAVRLKEIMAKWLLIEMKTLNTLTYLVVMVLTDQLQG